MASTVIRSVGIDIGTTTTQVIFSRLELVNRAAVSQVPHYEFTKREILYESPVIFTPIDFEGRIREEELLSFILDQYRIAGVTPEEIQSGAIIITGETSKARNARPAVLKLAETLGNFVVATAGPHLESIIAGQGSGASELSRTTIGRVLNIDIGGGTANYVLFEDGEVVDSACLNIGGRLLETDQQGRVIRAHAPGKLVCQALFGNQDPLTLNRQQLVQVTELMADLLYQVTIGQPSDLAKQLLMTDALPTSGLLNALTISGGVGTCVYQPVSDEQLFKFGDIGPLLARAITKHIGFAKLPLKAPKQTIRATVIGAGAHTLSLSGSTIWLKQVPLPIRNIPVMHTRINGVSLNPEELCTAWQQALTQHDLSAETDSYALTLPADVPVTYQAIQLCVEALGNFSQRYPNSQPLIVIARQDLGKVLGMLLQPHLGGRTLAVIDEVVTREGDYIDIGNPLFGGEIVPITVKSLAFPS
ncbi:ethanolamine ammonia-lyase reactivating factor EutA [Entomomonas asaccharolytica]|uniref:Ethanolamine ammonia-lyase reactivating factor EutA n=1 Tax=Entomomonas asaccharolytica TaxID=2785331 RepID=A0A974NHK6_9GAMM|nr:ethanolamine ammonia-lyase reactivating factor EutA [Entomomonas asaccharolytica]QQP86731.1 ethanolamine ammonia-lyase reactivating factor EutA [Entomomonas asaccharolytica]